MEEPLVNINVSEVPSLWIPDINKISSNFSKAVRTLIREALDVREQRKKAECLPSAAQQTQPQESVEV